MAGGWGLVKRFWGCKGVEPLVLGVGDRRSPNVPLLPSPKGRGWGRGVKLGK